MASEPNRSTIICTSWGLSQAFNHEETGLYLGFPKEDSCCRPKKFHVSQAVACKCHFSGSPAHMSQGMYSPSFFLPWLWVNKMVKSICEEAAVIDSPPETVILAALALLKNLVGWKRVNPNQDLLWFGCLSSAEETLTHDSAAGHSWLPLLCCAGVWCICLQW